MSNDRIHASKAWVQFDKHGEEAVRNAVLRGGYVGDYLKHAQSWLREKERQRETASQAESLDIAKSAKDAAWAAAEAARDAADAARKANEIAKTARLIAIAAAIISAGIPIALALLS